MAVQSALWIISAARLAETGANGCAIGCMISAVPQRLDLAMYSLLSILKTLRPQGADHAPHEHHHHDSAPQWPSERIRCHKCWRTRRLRERQRVCARPYSS